jgi:hypothetical protein
VSFDLGPVDPEIIGGQLGVSCGKILVLWPLNLTLKFPSHSAFPKQMQILNWYLQGWKKVCCMVKLECCNFPFCPGAYILVLASFLYYIRQWGCLPVFVFTNIIYDIEDSKSCVLTKNVSNFLSTFTRIYIFSITFIHTRYTFHKNLGQNQPLGRKYTFYVFSLCLLVANVWLKCAKARSSALQWVKGTHHEISLKSDQRKRGCNFN